MCKLRGRRLNSLIVAVTVILVGTVSAQASLIAYEGFDYAAGQALGGQNGGTGWNGAWNDVNRNSDPAGGDGWIISPGKTYSSLTTSGNAVQVTGNNTAIYDSHAVIERDLGQTLGDDEETVWIGVIAQRTNAVAESSFGGVVVKQGPANPTPGGSYDWNPGLTEDFNSDRWGMGRSPARQGVRGWILKRRAGVSGRPHGFRRHRRNAPLDRPGPSLGAVCRQRRSPAEPRRRRDVRSCDAVCRWSESGAV